MADHVDGAGAARTAARASITVSLPMCPVAICKAARLGGPYAAISQTRFPLRRWTIGPFPVSLYHRWTPWSPIKQKRNYYRNSFAILVHGSCVTFRGSFLSEGVSADDWGGSAGGAAPVHGIPLDVVLFCEVWCRGHASRCGAALSEGVSADDWGRWGEGPRRCMGHLWILFEF